MKTKYGQGAIDGFCSYISGGSTELPFDAFGIDPDDELDFQIACEIEMCEECSWYVPAHDMVETEDLTGLICWDCNRGAGDDC